MESSLSQTNPKYQHQYSELLQLGTTDSDGSATYTMPAYTSSDGSQATYSLTTPLYHNPNCQCHMHASQPPHCVSPTPQSLESADSNPMTNSCTKEVWVSKPSDLLVNRGNQPIAWTWTCLSAVIFTLCTLILTETGWLVNDNTGEGMGLIKQCTRESDNSELNCQFYAGLSSLKLPSISWKLTLILYCIADTLLGLSTFIALGTILLARAKTRRHLSFFTGYVQLFAGKGHSFYTESF